MRQLLVASVALLLLPGVARAQSPAPGAKPSAPAKPSPTSTAPAAGAEVEKHNVVGTVVSVDEAKTTITFKDPKGQTLTWKTEDKATARLKSLKAGQKVKIAYSVDEKGAPKAATGIRFVAGKGKKAEKAEAPAPK